MPTDYEVLPPHLLGDELLFLSSEKSLKATALGDLLPKELISQNSENDDNMDRPTEPYLEKTTLDPEKNLPINDLLPPPLCS